MLLRPLRQTTAVVNWARSLSSRRSCQLRHCRNLLFTIIVGCVYDANVAAGRRPAFRSAKFLFKWLLFQYRFWSLTLTLIQPTSIRPHSCFLPGEFRLLQLQVFSLLCFSSLYFLYVVLSCMYSTLYTEGLQICSKCTFSLLTGFTRSDNVNIYSAIFINFVNLMQNLFYQF